MDTERQNKSHVQTHISLLNRTWTDTQRLSWLASYQTVSFQITFLKFKYRVEKRHVSWQWGSLLYSSIVKLGMRYVLNMLLPMSKISWLFGEIRHRRGSCQNMLTILRSKSLPVLMLCKGGESVSPHPSPPTSWSNIGCSVIPTRHPWVKVVLSDASVWWVHQYSINIWVHQYSINIIETRSVGSGSSLDVNRLLPCIKWRHQLQGRWPILYMDSERKSHVSHQWSGLSLYVDYSFLLWW